jgi:hypothetical protein
MTDDPYDPTFTNARREAAVILIIYSISLLYTILFCNFFGYDRDPETIRLYFGIPDWVAWGVLLPWTINVLVTFWFCFFYMAEDDLENLSEEVNGETGESFRGRDRGAVMSENRSDDA